MSDNRTRYIDRDCPSKDSCARYMAEIIPGAAFRLHSQRMVTMDQCDEWELKEGA